MRWLTVVAVVVFVVGACTRPVAAPVEHEPPPRDATVTPPPDAQVEEPAVDAPVRAAVLRTRLIRIEVVGAYQIGTLPVGSDQGVTKDWTGCLLSGSSDRCLSSGELEIVRVEPRLTRVRLRMTEATELIRANPHVQLAAPP